MAFPNPFAALGRLMRFTPKLMGGGFFPAAPVLSGTFVTPESAIGLAACYAAINVISRDIASTPRFVYRKVKGGGWDIEERDADMKRLNDLLNVAANDETDSFTFLQTTVGHTLGWGNGLSQIIRSSGYPVGFQLLHPSKTKVKRKDGKGRLYYELEDESVLSPENVLHLSGLGFNGTVGYSPVSLCRQSVGLALGVEQYQSAFYGNSALPLGWIKLQNKLTAESLFSKRQQYQAVHQGSQSAHRIGFLEEGAEWVNSQLAPDDSKWIATRAFQVKEIARMFNLPPHKIGDYSESHLANVEEANRDYLDTTLTGWVRTIEAQLNWKLLSARDREKFRIRFDLEAFKSGNTQARMMKYQTLRNVGAITADEIRLAEGLNPVGEALGGNLLVIQGQYISLDQVGKAKESIAPPADPSAKPKDPLDANSPDPAALKLDSDTKSETKAELAAA